MNINGTSHTTEQWIQHGQARHAQLLQEAREARLLALLPRAQPPPWRVALDRARRRLLVLLRLRPALTAALLLGAVAAVPLLGGASRAAHPATITAGPQDTLAVLSGQGLTRAEGTRRLQELESRLRAEGYHRRGSLRQDDGTLTSLWSHPGRRVSVVVALGDQADGTSLRVDEIAGLPRWNEVRGLLT